MPLGEFQDLGQLSEAIPSNACIGVITLLDYEYVLLSILNATGDGTSWMGPPPAATHLRHDCRRCLPVSLMLHAQVAMCVCRGRWVPAAPVGPNPTPDGRNSCLVRRLETLAALRPRCSTCVSGVPIHPHCLLGNTHGYSDHPGSAWTPLS